MAYLEDETLDQKALDVLSKMKNKPLAKRVIHEQSVMNSVGIALACQLFEEAKEAFENGEMKWQESIDDLHESLKSIPEDLFKEKASESED